MQIRCAYATFFATGNGVVLDEGYARGTKFVKLRLLVEGFGKKEWVQKNGKLG